MDNQEKKIQIQFYLRDKKIYWKGNVHVMDDELINDFLINFNPYLSSENDKIVLFNWFDDDTYVCEREKNIFDYRLQTKVKVVYNAVLTTEQANIVKDKLLEIFEETRIRFLSKNKEIVRQKVLEDFSIATLNLRGLRSVLLSKSDWTQMPDAALDSEVKERWAKYRQTLRDISKDENWAPRNILNVNFPLDPENYLLRYPNKEVEYLSTPDQFENHAALDVKVRLASFMQYLALPSAMPDDTETTLASYEKLEQRLKKFMAKIDPEMELDIKFKTTFLGACSDSGTNLQSGLTEEAKQVLAELIKENPDVYYRESAERVLNEDNSIEILND